MPESTKLKTEQCWTIFMLYWIRTGCIWREWRRKKKAKKRFNDLQTNALATVYRLSFCYNYFQFSLGNVKSQFLLNRKKSTVKGNLNFALPVFMLKHVLCHKAINISIFLYLYQLCVRWSGNCAKLYVKKEKKTTDEETSNSFVNASTEQFGKKNCFFFLSSFGISRNVIRCVTI